MFCWVQKASWKFIHAARIRRPNGFEFLLTETPPATVKEYITGDLRLALLAPEVLKRPLGLEAALETDQSSEDIRDRGLWTLPPNTFWESTKRPPRQRRIVRQIFCGSYITAAKLHSWGYQVSPLCSLCKARPDSAWHCAFEFDAKAGERAEIVDDALLHEALAAGPDDNLFGKLWMPIPEIKAHDFERSC
eukprot:8250760-Pyramimonas_sp.AAC.1